MNEHEQHVFFLQNNEKAVFSAYVWPKKERILYVPCYIWFSLLDWRLIIRVQRTKGMQGLLPVEEIKVRLGLAERFSRRELAMVLGDPMAPLSPVQVTRDIQAIYGHMLDRRPIPYEVAIELYLVRLFRLQRVDIELAAQVSRDEIKDFIDSFDSHENPTDSKWAWAERFGGGQRHFEQIVVARVRASRQQRLTPMTYNTQAIAA